ncbi:MAG: hypothetical protein RJB38_326 [Pseudomonadota bacterium]|jgi:hypothetical protein
MSSVILLRRLVFGLLVLCGACGKIPSDYRGNFVDSQSGFSVELRGNRGIWQRPDGSREEFTARAASVEELLQGKAAVYLRSVGERDLEVFWVRPEIETRQEEYGFVAYQGEVLYSRFDSSGSQGKVGSIQARYCERGQILIDQVTKTFNGGCPAQSRLLELVRVGK